MTSILYCAEIFVQIEARGFLKPERANAREDFKNRKQRRAGQKAHAT